MKALILTGPRDGELTDWTHQQLDMVGPIDEVGEYIPILHFKRVTFCDGEKYVSIFVPNEWPITGMQGMVLNHLIRRAFKDAEK